MSKIYYESPELIVRLLRYDAVLTESNGDDDDEGGGYWSPLE